MAAERDSDAVGDDTEDQRFVVCLEGHVAELDYDLDGNRLILIHTEVPESIGGRGIGGRLVRAAVDRAVADGLTLVPWCPYARKWLREHPDIEGAVTIDWRARPPS